MAGKGDPRGAGDTQEAEPQLTPDVFHTRGILRNPIVGVSPGPLVKQDTGHVTVALREGHVRIAALDRLFEIVFDDPNAPACRVVRPSIEYLINLAVNHDDLVDVLAQARGVETDTRNALVAAADLDAEWRATYLADLPALDAAEVAKILGAKDHRSLSKNLRSSGRAVAFKWGKAYRFPAFQFDQHGFRARVEDINRALDAAGDSRGALGWWLTPNPDLAPVEDGVADPSVEWPTPADVVSRDPERVLELAASLVDADSF